MTCLHDLGQSLGSSYNVSNANLCISLWPHNSIPLPYYNIDINPEPKTMTKISTRHYHRVAEDKRIGIIALQEKGCTLRDISRLAKVKLSTVRNVLGKWKTHRTNKDLPKKGRKPKVDDRTRRRLARMMQRGEVSTSSELALTAASCDVALISESTVCRTLHQAGLNAMHTIPKPLLTRAHKRKRLEFARSHGHWTVEDWKQVIFSDETVIAARPSDAHKLRWTKPTRGLNPRLVVPTVRGGGANIMAWGCISRYGFHDFIRLDGTVTGTGYVEVLQKYLLPVVQKYFHGHPFIFQQDNAPVHTAREVVEFFEDQNLQVLEWPPHSPDLNIIEHVWHYLKEAMAKLTPAGSKAELWSNVNLALVHMWSPPMMEKINKLYESLPNRMEEVIAAHGGNTSY